MQVDPRTAAARTVFLHVLTAADAGQAEPPPAAYRVVRPGVIEVTVDGAKAELQVPEWVGV